MTQQQRELAESLVALNSENKIGGSAFASVGKYAAACGIIADNIARHDPAFDRNAFMAACGV
jgi:hypothetical protein